MTAPRLTTLLLALLLGAAPPVPAATQAGRVDAVPADGRGGGPSGHARAAAGSPDTARAAADGDWRPWARAGAALVTLYTLDRPVRTAALELEAASAESSPVDRIADRAEWFGDWRASLPWVVGGSLAVGQLTGGSRGLREGAAVLAGTAAAAMANEALNRAVGRARPYWGEGAASVEPFRGHASFPSGHTAYVFGVASGVDVVTDGRVPAIVSYGVAGLTGLSRIYHDRHWLTDVVAGAALGTVVSRLATREALRVLDVRDRGGEGRSPEDAGAGRPPPFAAGAGPTDLARAASRDAGGLRAAPLLGPRTWGVTLRF